MKTCLAGLFLVANAWPVLTHEKVDVAIYGCTPAGLTAAIQLRRLERSVVLLCPSTHVGGMTTSGLGYTDSGDKAVIGGMALEFYTRIKGFYDHDGAWTFGTPLNLKKWRPDSKAAWLFEPHVARAVFDQMLDEAGIHPSLNQKLDREAGVTVTDGKIVSATMLSGKSVSASVFIDATYEGDLMAAAGVSYSVGRESNLTYGETLNGAQPGEDTHQFDLDIDPWLIPGNPESGLLPGIGNQQPGKRGEGDHRIQAYNFRLCMTDLPINRVPVPKPAGYDPMQYELLGRYLDAGWKGYIRKGLPRKFDAIPNRKTDTNNHGAFSTDNIGMNYRYPEASYGERKAIIDQHRNYQQGLLWFLANDPRTPIKVRETYQKWGLCKDEFQDNAHWPPQIYVREARRMTGATVMTENHLTGKQSVPKPVGMGSYNIDSHNVMRYVDEHGFVRNEGDVQVKLKAPYQIDYGALVPRREEIGNLLVPVAVSASHAAYGSIRMEPVFMILGQSAGLAADIAFEADIPVQQVPYSKLETALKKAGQVLKTPAIQAPT